MGSTRAFGPTRSIGGNSRKFNELAGFASENTLLKLLSGWYVFLVDIRAGNINRYPNTNHMYSINCVQCWTNIEDSDIYRRQILTSIDSPRTERIKTML